MNNKTMIEWLQELPLDYELCFSEKTSVIVKDDNDEEVEYIVTLDDPIIGLLKNDETKEIRFFSKKSKEHLQKEIEDGKNWKYI